MLPPKVHLAFVWRGRNLQSLGRRAARELNDIYQHGFDPMGATPGTSPNVRTSVGRRGTVFPSSVAGRPGTRLRYQTCSSDVCTRRPRDLLYAATSHRAGIEYADRT